MTGAELEEYKGNKENGAAFSDSPEDGSNTSMARNVERHFGDEFTEILNTLSLKNENSENITNVSNADRNRYSERSARDGFNLGIFTSGNAKKYSFKFLDGDRNPVPNLNVVLSYYMDINGVETEFVEKGITDKNGYVEINMQISNYKDKLKLTVKLPNNKTEIYDAVRDGDNLTFNGQYGFVNDNGVWIKTLNDYFKTLKFKIIKREKGKETEDTTNTLAIVEKHDTKKDEEKFNFIESYNTDQGAYVFKNVPIGSYELIQATQYTDFVITPTMPAKFTIDGGGNIRFEKKIPEISGIYQVVNESKKELGEWSIVGNYTTGPSGEVKLEVKKENLPIGLEQGDYRLVETKAPNGYTLPTLDSKDNKGNPDGYIIAEFKVDENGKIYVLVEQTGEKKIGYMRINGELRELNNSEGKNEGFYEMFNDSEEFKFKFNIHKVEQKLNSSTASSETTSPDAPKLVDLQGAEFEIYRNDAGSIGQQMYKEVEENGVKTKKYSWKTDEKGIIEIDFLSYGKYKLVEKTPPAGYAIPAGYSKEEGGIDFEIAQDKDKQLYLTGNNYIRIKPPAPKTDKVSEEDKTDAENYNYKDKGITVKVGEKPEAKDTITFDEGEDKVTPPERTVVVWKEEPKVDEVTPPGTPSTGKVTVIYPDGSREDVDVTIKVVEQDPDIVLIDDPTTPEKQGYARVILTNDKTVKDFTGTKIYDVRKDSDVRLGDITNKITPEAKEGYKNPKWYVNNTEINVLQKIEDNITVIAKAQNSKIYEIEVKNTKVPSLQVVKYAKDGYEVDETGKIKLDESRKPIVKKLGLKGVEFELYKLKYDRDKFRKEFDQDAINNEKFRNWLDIANYEPVKENGVNLKFTSGEDGKFEIDFQEHNLGIGVYALRETKKLDGYAQRNVLAVFELDTRGAITPWNVLDGSLSYEDYVEEHMKENEISDGTPQEKDMPRFTYYVENLKEKSMYFPIDKIDERGGPVRTDSLEFKLQKLVDEFEESGQIRNHLTENGKLNPNFEIVKLTTFQPRTKILEMEYSTEHKLEFDIEEFSNGFYILTESKSPEGYALTNAQWLLEFNWDREEIILHRYRYSSDSPWEKPKGKVEIESKSLYRKINLPSRSLIRTNRLEIVNIRVEFPDTGGYGAALFSFGGMAIMAAAYILHRKRVME